MKKRNLNILASLVIALALTGCNESEVDKITLIKPQNLNFRP